MCEIDNFTNDSSYALEYVRESPWKVTKIIPLIDIIVFFSIKKFFNILDIGGRYGLILKMVAKYMKNKYDIYVNECVLDINWRSFLLNIKNKNCNFKIINDICFASINDKKIDVALVIDVIEHVSDQHMAMNEIKRISNYSIFKIPLEKNLSFIICNLLTLGNLRKKYVSGVGHVNQYNFKDTINLINIHEGKIIYYSFSNIFNYQNHHINNLKLIRKIYNILASLLYKISPYLCSLIFTDYIMILVRF